jgi:putative transposase
MAVIGSGLWRHPASFIRPTTSHQRRLTWQCRLQYKPKRLITDGLRSYGVARRALLPDVKHRTSRYLNNRAENSHRPTRRRERQMQRFKSSGQAQEVLSAHAMIYGHFRPRRHRLSAGGYRRARAKAFRVWRQETSVQQVG